MEKLYKSLYDQGKYTKSFEDFQTQFGSNEGQEKLYGALKSSGDYTKSFNDFSGQFFGAPVKTNDSASADPAVESNKNATGSKSEDGSLESQPELTTWQSIKNSLSNVAENFDDVLEFWGDDGGKDAAKDIATNAIYSSIFGQKNLENKDAFIGGDIGAENTLNALKRYEEDQKEMKQTKGIIESYNKGDYGGMVAGAVNAVTNGFGSMVYGVGTGFMGYMADFTARNYAEYNKQKAENLGISLEELVKSGEAETVVPVALGTANMAAEVIGDAMVAAAVVGTKGKIKGPAAFAVRKLPKKLLNKIMYSKKAKAALTIFGTGVGEFATEITQHGTDAVNDELGRVAGTKEDSKVIEAFYNAIASEEGLEAGLQGLVGAGGMVGGSYSIKAMNSVRQTVDGDMLDKNLESLSAKQLEFAKATDETVKEGIQAEIDTIEENIANQVIRGNKIYNSLTNGQISELESFSDLADAAAFKITELNKKKRLNQISESEYNVAKQGFESQYNSAKQGIQDMNLAKNIDFLEDTVKNEGFAEGIETTVLDSTLETEAAMEGLSEVDKKDKQEYFDDSGRTAGFTVGKKIFINKEAARNTGQINVGKHEFLHKIINAKVGGIGAQIKMVKDLRRSLTSKQRKLVDQTVINRGYKSKNRFNTEYVQVLSDLIAKEKISFEKSALGKMGDAFKRFFVGNGFEKISFKDGRGVLNFVKDYTKNTKELSAEAKEAIGKTNLAKEGGLQFSKDINDQMMALDDDLAAGIIDQDTYDARIDRLLDDSPKEKPAPKPKETKPARTTDLGPRDPKSKKIMDTYNKTMDNVERTNYTKNNPLPAKLEAELVPMFEGYINSIVQQKFKQLGPEALEFQDALSILRAEVVSAIRTFNPAVNKDLAGYVKRYGVQARQSLMFKDANKEFTSELDDAKNVANNEEPTGIDRSGTVERGQATFDELDVVDDALVKDIKNDLEKELRVRAQKGTLSEMVGVKRNGRIEMISWVEEYINKKLFKNLSKKLGAVGEKNGNTVIPPAYIDFLQSEKSFDIITKALPIASIKKSYSRLFDIKKVGRELTPEGNPIFNIEKINKTTFFKYFVDGKKSTILERQKQLFREILTPVARQVIADYATPENIASLESMQELAPEQAVDIVENIVIKAQLDNLNSKLDRYKSEASGFDIIQFAKAEKFEGTYNRKEVTAAKVNKALKLDEHSSEFLSLSESLRLAAQWVRESLDLKGTTLGGLIYEVLTIGRVDSNAKKLKLDLTVKTLRGGRSAGFDSNRPDIVLNVIKNKIKKLINFELKQTPFARFGQTTLKVDFKNKENPYSISSKRKNKDGAKVTMKFEDVPTGKQLKKAMEKAGPSLKKILGIINKTDGTNIQTFPLGATISMEALAAVKKSKDYKNISKIETGADGQTVSDHYNAKDTSLLQVGGIGTFLMGDDIYGINDNNLENVPNLKDFEFTGDMRLKIYYKYDGKGRKAKNRIGAYMSLISEPQLKNKKNLPKSPVNLDTPRGLQAFYNRLQFSKNEKVFNEDMADVVTARLFPQPNKPSYLTGYKYLTEKQKQVVIKEMRAAKLIQFSKALNKAKAMVNRPDAPVKGISVWDFDDTLATTKSNVLYTLPDGTKGKINATEFALKSEELSSKGAEFDFSEFTKVMKGKKGPMFDKAIARNKKFGNNNVFILTARPADAKYAIHEFLKGIGLNIKLDNIVGLADGDPIAKAMWVVEKVSEGYNDFYFADDAYKNVKAVQEVLDQADVKSKVHQAKVQFSKDLNKEFNDIIENATGVKSSKIVYEAASRNQAENKGKYDFFIPPSAEDFVGLMYKLLGKGKKGDAQMAWFKKSLFDPFAKGIRNFESYKQNAVSIVNSVMEEFKTLPTNLEDANAAGFTNEQAVRVILWAKNGYDIPGLSKQERSDLINIVKNDKDLLSLAKQLQGTLGTYSEPTDYWFSGGIKTDIIALVNTSKRAEFLQEWQANADIIFSKDNINKLRSQFGEDYVEALQDMLYRMKTGRNRPSGANKQTNKFLNWVNDSVGTIMFFNSRSALLQTLSIVNFINFSDNNPIEAAKAFSNSDQFWSDFSMLFNSDFLKQRRSGVKTDINADSIVAAAENSKNSVWSVTNKILKLGFLPTQMADSFAIAMGGASFFRNRLNKYKSEGMDAKAAKEKAFLDFQEIAEETQQSSRPDRVSAQQASSLGRIILAFANTPMQYMRLTKKAFLDLKNDRGDWKTNVSKIVYYTAVQNIIFSSLQAAMFASLFEDEDEETIENKQLRAANSIGDSILRGTGLYGAIVATLKNVLLEINKQSKKDRPDYEKAALRSLSISPPVDSKIRKLLSAARAFSYKTTREKMKGYGLDNPAFLAVGQIVSATTNVPLDRVIKKMENIQMAFSNETAYWQKVALMFGYSKWDLGLIEDNSTSGGWKKRTSNKKKTNSKWKKRQ